MLLTWSIDQPPSLAASHREAPLIAGDPLADNTDVYAFRSYEPGRENYVTLLWNHVPGELPSAGPQYYPFGNDILYDVKIDNTGDGEEDITYRFTFQTQIVNPNSILGMTAPNQDATINSLNDPDYNQRQTYTVSKLQRNMLGRMSRRVIGQGFVVPPNNIGSRATPNYETLASQAIYTLPSGERVFAGQRDEGFYLDLGGTFDNLFLRSTGATGGVDSLAGLNVNTLAIEVPIADLTRHHQKPTDPNDAKAVIGVYSTASRCATKIVRGGCEKPVQVSRMANPLFNELLVPLRLKDKYNASEPENDQQFANFVRDPQLAQILTVVFPGLVVPPAPRNDLVAILTTGIPPGAVPGFATRLTNGKDHDLLRLNVAIAPTAFTQQSRLGILGGDLAGYPNGRRVNDDVVDISLRAVAGGTPFTPATNSAPNNALGDGVSQNDVPFLNRFPYLGTPASGNPRA